MAENKMEQVAALFGKKLNEPFTIKGERYIFGEKGFGYGNKMELLVMTQVCLKDCWQGR